MIIIGCIAKRPSIGLSMSFFVSIFSNLRDYLYESMYGVEGNH
jgi:hypothetical protein